MVEVEARWANSVNAVTELQVRISFEIQTNFPQMFSTAVHPTILCKYAICGSHISQFQQLCGAQSD